MRKENRIHLSLLLIMYFFSLSVLDGVPVSVKDEAAMLPYKTSLGTGFLNIVGEDDAHSVGLFRAAGCLLIGKASMHEVGIDITNCNPNTGTPRNPYNLDYYTGGSSGGSACSVAAGKFSIYLLLFSILT